MKSLIHFVSISLLIIAISTLIAAWSLFPPSGVVTKKAISRDMFVKIVQEYLNTSDGIKSRKVLADQVNSGDKYGVLRCAIVFPDLLFLDRKDSSLALKNERVLADIAFVIDGINADSPEWLLYATTYRIEDNRVWRFSRSVKTVLGSKYADSTSTPMSEHAQAALQRALRINQKLNMEEWQRVISDRESRRIVGSD